MGAFSLQLELKYIDILVCTGWGGDALSTVSNDLSHWINSWKVDPYLPSFEVNLVTVEMKVVDTTKMNNFARQAESVDPQDHEIDHLAPFQMVNLWGVLARWKGFKNPLHA